MFSELMMYHIWLQVLVSDRVCVLGSWPHTGPLNISRSTVYPLPLRVIQMTAQIFCECKVFCQSSITTSSYLKVTVDNKQHVYCFQHFLMQPRLLQSCSHCWHFENHQAVDISFSIHLLKLNYAKQPWVDLWMTMVMT